MIVGRDTDSLDAEGVTKAAVETVAENTSDGVIAPLLFSADRRRAPWICLQGGQHDGLMLGYKEETYLYIGRTAAKADDVVNYIPARISALLMIAGAFLCGMDGNRHGRFFGGTGGNMRARTRRRQNRCAQGRLEYSLPETPVISANDIKKRRSGDPLRSVEAEDIKRACLADVCDRDFDAVFVRQSSLPALSDLKRPGKRGCIFRSRTSFVRNIRKRRSKKKEKKRDAL